MPEPIPIPIPIRDDLGPEPGGSPGGGSGPTTSDRLADLLVDVIAACTNGALALLDPSTPEERSERRTGAAAGLLIEGVRATGALLGAVERSLAGPAAAADGAPVLGDLLTHWRATWDRARADEPALGEAVLRAVDSFLDGVDLTSFVESHIDVGRLAAQVDVNALVADLDIDALTARIDVEALAARINVDALARGIDIQALVDRLDLAAIASEVIDELDLTHLIAETTRDTASDGVRTVRLRSVQADRAVRTVVDRILARGDGMSSS
jgi:hypothetical protein